MKKCPKCNNQYSDDGIQFCLVDGEPLVALINVDSYNSAPTVVLPSQTSAPVPAGNGLNKFFVGATVVLGLLLIIAGTALVSIYIRGGREDDKARTNTEAPVKETDEKRGTLDEARGDGPGENAAAPEKIPAETPTPITVRVPDSTAPDRSASQSKLFGAKSYGGSVGGRKTNFNMTWRRDNSIVGSFYFIDNPDDVYSVAGSNYREGKAQLAVSYEGSNVGSVKLSKTIEGKILCWQGTMSGNVETIGYTRICRYR